MTGIEGIIEKPELDFVFLADRAYVDQTGLYVSGGARDVMFNEVFDDRPLTMAFVVGCVIPWAMAGQRQLLRCRLEDEDGRQMGISYSREIWVNLTEAVEEGHPLRHTLAETCDWPLPAPSTYVLIVSLGDSERRVRFHVREPRTDSERAATR